MKNLLKRVTPGETYHGAKVIKVFKGKSPYRSSKRKPNYRVLFIKDNETKELSIHSFKRYYLYRDLTF